ncbi:MAG: hypothetical protein O7D94_06540 [Planctomycetota bacterium]|nr:hypothetical protein [Planctomycetota bacterium]
MRRNNRQLLPPQFDEVHSPSRIVTIAGLCAIFVLALGLRTVGTNVHFRSSDNSQLAYFTTYWWGYLWFFQTNYGPLQPMLTKGFAMVATGLGMPMNEFLWRLPMGAVGAALPIVTFFLVRRVSRSGPAAWAAACWTAVLPPLVTDARYLWAYETLGATCAATVLLIALRYIERPGMARQWMLGIALAAYLWSHLLIYALPVTVVILFVLASGREGGGPASGLRAAVVRAAKLLCRPGVIIPPVAAFTILLLAHWQLGGGPVGRFTEKVQSPMSRWRDWNGIVAIGRLWWGHYGWVFGPVVCISLVVAARRALQLRSAHSVFWWWAVLFVSPIVLIAFPTIRPGQYLTQASYAGMLLCAAVLVPAAGRRLGRRATAVLVVVLGLSLALGAVDSNFNAGRFEAVTGVNASWGAVNPNRGFKTAAWYVRSTTRPEHLVCTLHDYSGLEWLPSGYYFGRGCLAYSDMKPEQSAALLEAYRDRVDVIVCERRLGIAPTWTPAFERVATVRERGTALIDIYARPRLRLPGRDLDVETYDERFDREFGARILGRAMPLPPGLPPYREMSAVAESIRRGGDPALGRGRSTRSYGGFSLLFNSRRAYHLRRSGYGPPTSSR